MDKVILTSSEELETLIQNSINNSIKADPHEKGYTQSILSLTEACNYLNLAKQTIYGFTSKRLIPFIKKGKKLYFKKSDLEEWLLEGKQLTKKEIESKKGGVFS